MAALDLLGLLKAELGITGTDQDQMLGALLEGAKLQIEAWCMLSLSVQQCISFFPLDEGAQGRPLVLDGPVLEIISVQDLSSGQMFDSANLSRQGDLLYPPQHSSQTTVLGGGSWNSRAVKVTYRSGYDLASDQAPSAILRALIMLAANSYALAGRDPLLKSESVAGVGSTSWVVADATTGGMPAQVAALLEPYRRIGIA